MKCYHLTLCLFVTAKTFHNYAWHLIFTVIYDILFI